MEHGRSIRPDRGVQRSAVGVRLRGLRPERRSPQRPLAEPAGITREAVWTTVAGHTHARRRARAGLAGAAPGADEHDYCAPGTTARSGPTAAAYDVVFVLGTGVVTGTRADLEEVVKDGARLRPLGGYLAVAHLGVAPRLGFAGGRTGG